MRQDGTSLVSASIANRLARALAQRTGETLTEAVINAFANVLSGNSGKVRRTHPNECFRAANLVGGPLLFKGDDFGQTDVMVAPY